MNGKLIVFEGTDGSGKATQTRLLCQALEEKGIPFKKLDFPRYQEDSSALIRLYLKGAFGQHPDDVNAYAAATFYAVDRYASYKQDWGPFYEAGGLLIADRYTTSNAVHQGAKLPKEEQDAFFDWLYDLEYGKLGLPRPDKVIYLEVDVATSMERMRHRQEKTHTQADIHEKDEDYLENCLLTGERAADHYGWQRVPFVRDGEVRALEEKHGEIYSIVRAAIR